MRRPAVFVVTPLVLSLPLVAMYYSGNRALQELVAPDLPDLSWAVGREMGLVENLENVLLAAIFACAAAGLWRRREVGWRVLFAGLAAAAAFVLGEEMDWGLHLYEFVTQIPTETAVPVPERSWHSSGAGGWWLMLAADCVAVGLFVVGPRVREHLGTNAPWVRLVLPHTGYTVLVGVSLGVVALVNALELCCAPATDTLQQNSGEFMELLMYYVFLVYVARLAFARPAEAGGPRA